MKEDIKMSRYYITRPVFVPMNKRPNMPLGANPEKIANLFRQEVPDIDVIETSMVIGLNNNFDVLGYSILATGNRHMTIMEPLIIAKFALDTMATNITIVHNHPTGLLNLSKEDKKILKKITLVLRFHDVKLIDFIIVSGISNLYYSSVQHKTMDSIIDYSNKQYQRILKED